LSERTHAGTAPEKAPQPLSILIADDHAVLRTGLRLILETQKDFKVVAEAMDPESTLEKALEFQPAMIIMDLAMPDVDISLVEQLARKLPESRILILSMHNREDFLRETLHAGARGYALKSNTRDNLLQAIRAVARGELYVDPALTHLLVKGILLNKDEKPHDLWQELSDREKEVVLGVVKGKTNREIADTLFLSIKTVETYRARAMEKLGFASRAELTDFALRHGLLKEHGKK
jgi:two-component system response regulator NreC